MASTLLQGVLRNSAADLDRRAPNGAPAPDKDDSDDELVNVVSLPGTPARSRPASRPASPTRGAASRRLPGPLHLTSTKATTDPLKVFATEISSSRHLHKLTCQAASDEYVSTIPILLLRRAIQIPVVSLDMKFLGLMALDLLTNPSNANDFVVGVGCTTTVPKFSAPHTSAKGKVRAKGAQDICLRFTTVFRMAFACLGTVEQRKIQAARASDPEKLFVTFMFTATDGDDASLIHPEGFTMTFGIRKSFVELAKARSSEGYVRAMDLWVPMTDMQLLESLNVAILMDRMNKMNLRASPYPEEVPSGSCFSRRQAQAYSRG